MVGTWDADTDARDATQAIGVESPPPSGTGQELRPGAALGDYVIERLVGRGGWGAVYSAWPARAARPAQPGRDGESSAPPGGPVRVAIKVLHSTLSVSPPMVERFVREVRLVRLLHHPNIVEIDELGELDDGRPYYVMEYLEGEPLMAALRRRGPLPAEEAVAILEPVCAALAAAHEAGVIHRDVKASNIMVLSSPASGERQSVKLIDFGVAKLLDDTGSGFTTVGRRVGTLSAMAPEQIYGGHVDARTDVYALGILLYLLLTGQHPFWSDDEVELAWRHLEEPPPRPSARAPVPPALDAVVLRALEKAPDRRFDSAGSFFAALSEAVGGPSAVVPHASECFAVGIQVTLFVEGEEEIGPAELADAGVALDRVENTLREEGYVIALAAGPVLLAVRPAGEDLEAERRAALIAARALSRGLAERADASPRLRHRVRIHVDQARMRLSPVPELSGGPLADFASWPASAELGAREPP